MTPITGNGTRYRITSPARRLSARALAPKLRPVHELEIRQKDCEMHYPHKTSKVKRARKIGFRVRMRTKKGRQMINRKRRVGRAVQVV